MKSALVLRLPEPSPATQPPPNKHPLERIADQLRQRLGPFAQALWQHKWLALSVVAALSLAIVFGPTLILGPRVVAESAVRALFLQTVVASGHVEAPFRVNIGSQITAVVASVPVVEGQIMKAGEPLIVLDDRELRATVLQAEGVVAQAEARIRQMTELTLPAAQQSLKQAQATLTNAQQAYDRALKLNKDGYRNPRDARRCDPGAGRRQGPDQKCRTATGHRAARRQRLRHGRNATRPGAREPRLGSIATELYRDKAPRDGVLISRNVEKGNTVAPPTTLMVLSPDGEIQLVVQIDEKNLGLIALGQQAIASADAYAKQTFPAEVFYVNPGIDLQRASVEVKLRVPKPPDYLRQDMTVSVDIEVARRENAVTLPAGSIHGIAGPKPWVMKVVGGRATRQPVAVGIVSGGKAEIVSGLDADDLVIPADQYRDQGRPARQGERAGRGRAVNRWAPFEWITAIRFLKEGRMQTMFIIAGVSIGVAVIVFMSALLAGLQANFIKRVLTSSPHIQLIPADEVARPLRTAAGVIEAAIVQRPAQRLRSIDQWQKVRAQLLTWPEITNVSPSVSAAALAVRGSASRSITMTGIDAEVYFNIVRLPDYIVAGQPRVNSDDIIVGLDLAKDLGVTVGDKLTVTSATGASRLLTISGIFDLGNKGANMRSTYVGLRTAQALANLSGGVTSIDLTVTDVYAAETIAQAVQRRDRRAGRQLDQDQRPVLHGGECTADIQHHDPHVRRLVGCLRHRQRAGGLGDPEIARHRHPARDGHVARSGAADFPAAGRTAGLCRLADRHGDGHRRAGLLAQLPAAGRRQRNLPAHPGTQPVRVGDGAGGADRRCRCGCPGVAGGETRSGGGDPWLNTLPSSG